MTGETVDQLRIRLNNMKGTILTALQQGTTPRQLALTVALGVVISIFPIFGTTTFMCFVAAIAFRLNVVLIQAVNYAAAPLQIALIIPFIKTGVAWFNLPAFSYSAEELLHLLRTDWFALARHSGLSLAAGAGVWLMAALPIFFILFASSLLIMQWLKTRTEI